MSLEQSKEYMKKNAIYPKISFKDKLKHVLTLVKEKIDFIPDATGVKEGMRYMVRENGELKTFFTTSAFLISTLSGFELGDIVNIQMVSKNMNGRIITTYEVSKEGEADEVVDMDEMPPIEEAIIE